LNVLLISVRVSILSDRRKRQAGSDGDVKWSVVSLVALARPV
jgi:hypothetical protein